MQPQVGSAGGEESIRVQIGGSPRHDDPAASAGRRRRIRGGRPPSTDEGLAWRRKRRARSGRRGPEPRSPAVQEGG
ncbi:hypothetical protein PVAP13_2NG233103 [Panicum virgatum]|uniref:Uncharacterized protein n=1 Tax=Panicum virgatum TaxID=38727 RepID=A0A8T0VQC6_PANVG|nr:hypothetical protein PVAP13_2NG233103 [Panicum virgatum]